MTLTIDKQCIKDPVELIIANALDRAEINYIHESENNLIIERLDFYLPTENLYIECARGHTARKIEQLSRVENVLYIQGLEAARQFAEMINWRQVR